MKRQQGGSFQRRFDFEAAAEEPRLGDQSAGGTQPQSFEEPKAPTAFDQARALTVNLMEEVTNLNRAYRRVMANKGAPGVDGMTVHELRDWIAEHKEELIASLLDGTYQPQPVRGVEIPKAGGGVRQLGIPTVVDRLVQQALLQVLERLCWTIWIRNWNAEGTSSVGTPTTAISTCSPRPPGNVCWLR